MTGLQLRFTCTNLFTHTQALFAKWGCCTHIIYLLILSGFLIIFYVPTVKNKNLIMQELALLNLSALDIQGVSGGICHILGYERGKLLEARRLVLKLLLKVLLFVYAGFSIFKNNFYYEH